VFIFKCNRNLVSSKLFKIIKNNCIVASCMLSTISRKTTKTCFQKFSLSRRGLSFSLSIELAYRLM